MIDDLIDHVPWTVSVGWGSLAPFPVIIFGEFCIWSVRGAVEAERYARYTEDQIRALSADYTIGLNDAGNVQMKFNLFESADLSTFAPLTLDPDSVSVVDGSICLEFAPENRAAFFRFSVE